MSNSYYDASGTPGTGSFGASSAVRSEFMLIQSGFDKLPALSSGVADCAVVINDGGTGLTNTVGTLALAAAFATLGGFGTTLQEQAQTTLTLPAYNATLATLAGNEALTNKTVNGLTIDSTTGALAIASGKTLTASNTLTFTGADGSSVNFGAGGAVLYSGTSLDLSGDVTGTTGATVVSEIQGVSVGTPTGTGNVVMSASPTLSGTVGGTLTFSGALTLSSALTYGGITLSNSVTGTGKMVLATAPTLAGLTLSAAMTYGGVTLNNAVTGTGEMVLSTSPTFSGTVALPDGSDIDSSSFVVGSYLQMAVGTNAVNIDSTLSFYSGNSYIYLTGFHSGGLSLNGDGANRAQSINLQGGASGYINISTSSVNSYCFGGDGSFNVGNRDLSSGAGCITATGNVTAYYSDDRLKTRLGDIEDPIEKIMSLNGFYYEANETAKALGYKAVREVGLSAQEVQRVFPEVVAPAPIDHKYLTLRYERIIPLLVEAIKAQQRQIQGLAAG